MAVVNNNNNAGIVEKALEGKVSFTDFKTFVTNYVTDQNAKCTVEATFSKNYLDFNLVNGLLSVAEFSDTTPNAYHIDSVTLMNTSKKHKLYFCFEVAKNPKYEMTVEPKEGCIKKGSAIVVNFKIRVFCTTRIYQLGKVFLSTSNPAKTSKLWWPTKPPEKMKNVVDHPQLQYLSFRIESDLSTSYDYDDLELGVQLARGGFGTVYVAKWRGSEVAVKMLSQDMIPEEKELVQREIGLMSKLNFQYIVTYMASTKIPGQPLCIIMEYVKEGSLKRLLKKSLDYSFKLKIALDIAKGLAFLHNNNIAHRDIKPDNVLVVSAQRGEHINVKLTDFGTSRCDAMYGKPQVNLNFSPVVAVKHDQPRGGSFHTNSSNNSSKSVTSNSFVEGHSTRTTLTKGVGTLIYSAPEILSGANNYDTQKTDIYSYGILLWELFTQKEPFSEPPMDKWTSREIAEHVINGKRFEIPPTITGELPAIIKACWSQEPDSRPPCNEIVKRLEMLYMDKPEPLPKQIQLDVGWMGEIEREEAENMLHGTVNGTFLFRWSKKQNTFVLSYKDAQAKDPRKPFSHISGITQGKTDMKVYVKTTTGQVVYAGFIEYVEAMRRNGVVSDAMQPRAEEESHYGVTADFKQQQNYDNVSQLRVAKN